MDLLNVDGWTYVPVREFSERMGWILVYDKETSLTTVENAIGDQLVFQGGTNRISFNGADYELPEPVVIEHGNAYFPLRSLAEAMHANVGWRTDEKLAEVKAVQVYTVAAGDTLWGIAEQHQTTAEALLLRNRMKEDQLQIGQLLKVVVPDFMLESKPAAEEKAEPKPEPATAVDPDELALLAKLVQVEAGNESYEGKLAVASVVMNRVGSADFPDTVKDVIYAPHQFPPATNGLMDKVKASEDCIKAARAALSGENNVPGGVYFFNAKREPGKLKLVEVVKVIGSHTFAK